MSRVLLIAACAAIFFMSAPGAAFESGGLREVSGGPFIVDLRYNTPDNFMHKNLYAKYGVEKCCLHKDAYDLLMKAAPMLEKKKLKLVMWDCFRPVAVQREMWKMVPDPNFVADPKKGSNHNRGMAMDVTLADERGKLLPMPMGFDDFSPNAAPRYQCPIAEKKLCEDRDLLIKLMGDAGFEVNSAEWWHYSPKGVVMSGYPVM